MSATIHLCPTGHGYKEPRARSSEDVTVEPCGCAHGATSWIQMCEPHWNEWVAERAAAREARRLQALAKELT